MAPYIVARNALGLSDFIERGIGGRVSYKELDADGKVAHLEVRIEDAIVMIGEAPPGRPLFPAMLHIYVNDPDAAYHRALAAGATSSRAPADAPDGRRGGVRDDWGNEWWFTRPSD